MGIIFTLQVIRLGIGKWCISSQRDVEGSLLQYCDNVLQDLKEGPRKGIVSLLVLKLLHEDLMLGNAGALACSRGDENKRAEDGNVKGGRSLGLQ